MSLGRLSFYLLGATLLVLAACAERPTGSQVSGSVTVRIPWKDEQGGVTLQTVVLTGLENLQEMKGAYAQFVYAPKILDDGIEGATPHAQFAKTSAGVYVPTDETSQQMAVIYAHMEHLAKLDEAAGVKSVLSWPRKIGISARIRGRDGQLWTDNSFYDGASDAILMVPNKKGQWPLATNPGVIAHEHFHALFFHLVQGPLLEEKVLSRTLRSSAHDEGKVLDNFDLASDQKKEQKAPRRSDLAFDEATYNTAVIKMINEGLADVWGWIYSGQPDFIEKSLPRYKTFRSLRAEGVGHRLTEPSQIATIVTDCLYGGQPDACVNDLAYGPGATLSRAVRSVFLGDLQDTGDSARLVRERLAGRLMKALPLVAEKVRTSTAESRMDLHKVLQAIMEAEETSSEEKAAAAQWLVEKPVEEPTKEEAP
ncbi:MAG: hypothetical protein KF789_01975 [Bdellovibrionaceae bacterium]|nr:hypothetical protein [Pseudobdellovibrionaceae bacterium]